jgi:uncharacterized membrane protein YdjX (TVP38/TMEM64 family)
MVHSKLMIVDDRLVRIGSANLCNRSMGVDSECDLTIEAADAADRLAIRGILARLLAEHCGMAAVEVERLIADTGSLFAVIDAGGSGEHRLVPADGPAAADSRPSAIEAVADPHHPLPTTHLIERALASVRQRWRGLLRLAPVTVAILLVALAWRYTALAEWARPAALQSAFQELGGGGWAPLLVVGVYVLGGLVAFPVTLLIAATAAAFGAWPGLGYAASGALASAFVTYLVGFALGEATLRGALGPRLGRVRDRIARRGVLAVATIRLVPIAPFTVVNLVAGAARIPILDYALGTILGLAPGLITLSALGDRVIRIFVAPSLFDLALFLGLVVAWISLSIGLQSLVSRRRDRS